MTDPNAYDVFEYFQQMNTLQERPGVERMLQGLAGQFDVAGLGVCAFSDPSKDLLRFNQGSVPKKFPWQSDGKILTAARASLGAEAVHDKSGEWLISAVMAPPCDELYLAWIFRPERNWSESERWQWTFASQALLRWYFEDANKTEGVAVIQRRLESAATISSRLIHEFGNFLTGIMGFTELAQSRAASDNTLAMYLQEVMLSASQGAEWIRRLHKFCQRGRGAIWPTHLASLLAAMEARDQAQGAKQRITIDVPADLPLVEVDSASVQSILQEIINNAREATKDKGTVTIQVCVKEMTAADCQNTLGALAAGPCVEISVSDEGPGFSTEARAKVFREPFYSSKPRHRGTGLLAAYGTLLRFKGGLSLDFEQSDSGACVRFFVPIAKLPVNAQSSAKPAHVLLVHSDTTLLESMRSVLEASGLRVSTVSASSAAMSTFQLAKPPFSLVIAETTMPRVSGFELARRILDHHSKAQFLFLNTQSSFHDFAEEEMLKRFVVLRWPIETAEFVKAVDNALTNPTA